jgi:membrane associated rhomboid family serine protease
LIPIRATIPSKRFPFVTILLIVANALVFIFELSLGERLGNFIAAFGMSPAQVRIDAAQHSYFWVVVPFFTSVFLHGGWLHLLGNMLYLWIFGDNVEDKMGHGRFALFYILCGLAGSVLQFSMNSSSTIPTIGASGAIAGVLGSYFLLFPKSKIVTLVPIFFFFTFIEIPAVLFLGFWFLMQFFYGTLALDGQTSADIGGVAWWAHVGGFASGLILVFPFRKYK